MKLSATAREELRRKLREHPDLTNFLPNKSAVSSLSKQELLDVSLKLGIDVNSIVKSVQISSHGMAAVLEPEELELWEHSEKHPAFKGVFEFNLVFEVLGQKVERRARLNYSWTPEWEYFDLVQGRVMVGWPGNTIGPVEVLAVPEGERWTTSAGGRSVKIKKTPVWTKIDLLEDGVLSDAVLDTIDDAIDAACRAEDAERRREHGR